MIFSENNISNINTLGQLVEAGYTYKSIKQELRDNLIDTLQNKKPIFEGIWGYEHTVVPELSRAILAQHNINLLGLRGQAKTRIARQLTSLLDAYIPIIGGSEINDDPLCPISRQAKDIIAAHGKDTPIAWLHRSQRYSEKLATPDVSIADLIGDTDPIKAAALRLPYSDERVIHFGLIPRANRSIFVINELPDLQARIQVALFNILQEGDVQIRGFNVRLPLDIQFVFTANPEDYTNRGSIVTPLKDRIDTQIITHYPLSIQIGKKITAQEARPQPAQPQISTCEAAKNLIETIAVEARESSYVDAKSGVSARLTIAAYETLQSTAWLRMITHNLPKTYIRVGDFAALAPAINGKIELVYEGEQQGVQSVAQSLISAAAKALFLQHFPNPESIKKQKLADPYQTITAWFEADNQLNLLSELNDTQYEALIQSVAGLNALATQYVPDAKADEKLFLMELALHGLAEFSIINKNKLEQTGYVFSDLMSGFFEDNEEDK